MGWGGILRGVSMSAALCVAVACAKGADDIDLGAGGADPDAGDAGGGAHVPSSDAGRSDAKSEPDDDSGSGVDANERARRSDEVEPS
jgi:hypothetical protein